MVQMHVSSSVFALRRWSLLPVCLLLALPVIHSAPSDVPAGTNDAVAAARAWLAEIDAGHYDQSYAEGCRAFHNKVTLDQWKTVLRALRPTFGAMVSRREISSSYRPDGVEGLDGECMLVTFNTSFSNIPSNTELVVLKKEDGQWRGAGYNAQPVQQDQGSAGGPVDPTQTQTQTQTQSDSRMEMGGH